MTFTGRPKSFLCILLSSPSSQTCQQFPSQVISVSTAVALLYVVIYPPPEKEPFSIASVWIFPEKKILVSNFHHFSYIALNIQIKKAELCFFKLNTNYGSFCVFSSSLSMFYTLRRFVSNFSLRICSAHPLYISSHATTATLISHDV